MTPSLPHYTSSIQNLKKITGILVLAFSLLWIFPQNIHAQSISDISNIKVDDLSDAQIRELIRRANEAGLSEFELIQMARLRGVSEVELEKLKERVEKMDISAVGGRLGATASKREPRKQADLNEITQGFFKEQSELIGMEEEPSPYFGGDIFFNKKRRLTFEPNLNIATPKNYVLGPGDLVYVDVYGQSEKYYESIVTADGFILLDNVGPVNISGKTIDEAEGIIRNRLSSFFTELRGSNPQTFMQLTLGNVRTIKVHLVGELRLPGTFTLSAFSTVFNALYAAGGPNDNGSMRSIKVIRNGKVVNTLDIYDFLVNGNASLNFRLQDQDVIMVDPFLGRVTVMGEVKRPKIFEVKEGENFSQLLEYAGGFTDEAFEDRISVTRITGKERAVSDIFNNQFSIFMVKGGDQYTVGKVLDRYSNRVQIKGAVFREGNFALTEGLTLGQLIKNADGIRGEAYLERASILRTNDDLSTEVISVNLRDILSGDAQDILLKREDVVRISSIYDLQEEFYVQITGEVRNPGTFPYSKQMTVEDLIILAGGLRESASAKDIEIARRSQDVNVGTFSELIPVNIDIELTPQENPITLSPYDNVIVRRKPNFTLDKLVQVEGQVNSPGIFSVTTAEERVSDLIQRAGGLTPYAYPKGATLIRRTEFFETESEQLRRQRNLQDLQVKLQSDPNNTEAQELLLERLFKDLGNTPTDVTEGAVATQSKREALAGIAETKSGLSEIKIKQREAVAIDLESILKNPGSDKDLILEEGDIISIPRQLQTVRMRGDVVYPATVRYEKDRGMKYYINRAGGYDIRANRKRTYVVYANGEVARTKGFLGIRSYPSVAPGAEVIVPTKGPRLPVRPGEIIGITTGIATLALIITQLNFE
ncbi:SLBB domain-containing protein [Aquiflexum lacus]|uniref:SLBB domain-containing protein n=1 Tax=Aquiflexum lacus TaxID=2483805 RepID=UPI0018962E1F|nr:SLBB domain-containing protein [Aquiflexum lacus]